MKKNSFITLAALFTVIGFFSCNQKQHTSTKITFDSIQVAKKIFLLQENDTTQPFSDVQINFIFPEKFKSEDDLARLQQIFIGTFFNDQKYDNLSPKAAFDAYLVHYEKSYKELSNDYYEDKNRMENGSTPSWYWYSLYLKNNILFENDSLVSYKVELSNYTGGAHGSYSVVYYNIDLNSLTTLTEEDLFVPNYKKHLTEIIINQLMQKYHVQTARDLLEQGFFDIEQIQPNNNFWLNDKGVHYTYNQYEIAPYSMGAVDVSIPYSDLTEILNPKTIAQQFID